MNEAIALAGMTVPQAAMRLVGAMRGMWLPLAQIAAVETRGTVKNDPHGVTAVIALNAARKLLVPVVLRASRPLVAPNRTSRHRVAGVQNRSLTTIKTASHVARSWPSKSRRGSMRSLCSSAVLHAKIGVTPVPADSVVMTRVVDVVGVDRATAKRRPVG